MADISKLKLPSGNVYNIKDEVARDLIAGGINYVIAWDGTSTPDVSKIPAGLVVTYNGTNYTGTLTAANATKGAFHLIRSSTQNEVLDVYDEYILVGEPLAWEKLGDTKLDLSDLGDLAYRDSVSLNKSTDTVLGEGTTFENSSSTVTFSGGTTDKVLGEDTTFALSSGTVTVTPTTTNIQASITNVAVGADTTALFLQSPQIAKGNLDTTTVPNVTSAGTASTWSFAMGSGNDSETLIISGANSTAPTLGTAKTVATGGISTSVTGNLIKDISFSQTNALTGVKVTTQPTVALSTRETSATGTVSVATGITSASVGTSITVGTNDKVTAVTDIGTGTAAAQIITVGSNDKVTALTNNTDVTVS